ncbi:EAL domain-containing protein [Sphingomonas sp. BIUV-7]|uniref:EAL domain-containing protein n=1 Tax=Sphingomonas natans TaxID=3063330 RepID=A0ABT8Y471_9SPHN|nr:EAL domain-containing protein [Sphingomonas sp. BIUV-7]MDO6413116.1 EAL domain-containing protein [Sphingomonas sp. BIUV-7]
MTALVRNLASHHDATLVTIAILVCLFGGYTLFAIADHSSRVPANRRVLWLGMGAVAGGVTIWATHFIAMLAYRNGMPVAYSAKLTAVSVVVAIAGTMLSVLIGRTMVIAWAKPAAGLALGATISTMHFIGMSAMSTASPMQYDHRIVAWSIVLGTLLTTLAIAAFGFLRRPVARYLSATLLFTAGVGTIHFGSMAAMQMHDHAGPAVSQSVPSLLAIAITFGVIVVIGIALGGARIAAHDMRRDADESERMRSLANLSLEGLIVLDEAGIVIDANKRIDRFLGRPVIGLHIQEILPNVHPAMFTDDLRSEPVESELPRADGSRLPVEVLVHRTTHLRRAALVVVVRDLSERVEAQRRVLHVARHDPLTGLPNRLLFMERLESAVARTARTHGKTALLYIDLDGFKSVNDVFGHTKGDQVLIGTASLIETTLRSGDTLARLGGDEFAIVQSDGDQPEAAERLARRIITEIERGYGNGRGDVSLGASIGIAIAPDDSSEPAVLVRHADIALYKAKEAGRGTYRFFESAMDEALQERHSIEADMRNALAAGEIFLVYQPQMNADTGEITGFEALVRWNHPERGIIPPDAFIPVAEQSGFIVPLGAWILREACREAASWARPLNIAVNLSPVQFQQGALRKRVETTLIDTGLAPERLELEITETALLRDRDATIATLNELKSMGIRIAMDDFGTGYSSLSNLQSFPFDKIKVDRSFVSTIEEDEKAASIVKAVISLGHSLSLPIVAEGVESAEQLAMLRVERCTEIQGYLIGRPLPISAFRHLIDSDASEAGSVAA